MPVVKIPMDKITDRESFHETFATCLNFPDFYGRNMDAWIDCMSDSDFNDGLQAAEESPGDLLTLGLVHAKSFRKRCPELFEQLIDCAAFVNWRRVQAGDRPMLAISYGD